MSEKTHLTRIVAPTLNDASITKSLSDAIDVINENFRKLASTPFLQGVKGDAYHTTVRHIFEDGKITNDGALLLNCIFETNISGGTAIKNVCEAITAVAGNSVPGSPLDSLISYVDSKPVFTNNDLYFYTLVDDAGDEYGEQLGQYYYFVDGRIKNLSDAYNSDSKTGLNKFVDYSGFYRYIPATDENNAKYERVEFLPTLYYDTENNDICWKYYNTKTGLSAIGPKGANGVSSIIKVVMVDYTENKRYGKITHVSDGTNEELWNKNISDIQEDTPLLICFEKNGIYSYAFGISKSINKEMNGVWDDTTIIDHLLENVKITDYLESVNNTKYNTDPKYIPIPYGGTTGDKTKQHILFGNEQGGLVLKSKNFNNGKFILNSYDVVFAENDSGTGENVTINKDGITLFDGSNTASINSKKIKLQNVELGNTSLSGYCAKFDANVQVFAGSSICPSGDHLISGNNLEPEYNTVGMPIGTMIMYYGPVDNTSKKVVEVGNCWLLCNGATMNGQSGRIKYAELIKKIGDTLPNMAGRTPVGSGKIEDENGNLLEFNPGDLVGRFTNDITLSKEGLNTNTENLKFKDLAAGDLVNAAGSLETQSAESKPVVMSAQNASNSIAVQSSNGVATQATRRRTTDTVGLMSSTLTAVGDSSVTNIQSALTPGQLQQMQDLFSDTTKDSTQIVNDLRNVIAEDTVMNAFENVGGGVRINNMSPSVTVNFLIKYK